MCVHAASWGELRSCVKKCTFQGCPRNIEGRLPVLFERKEDSLTQIRFVAVSQDPGVDLKSIYCLTSSEKIETSLIKDALKELKRSETLRAHNPRDRIKEIFQRPFDPSTGDIYWTHALKCLPTKSNNEISGHWEVSAPLCAKYFKNELDLIFSKKLTIIAFGGYALAMCLHVLDHGPLVNSQRIMEYIRTCNIDEKFPYGGKEVSLFPFLHPSYRDPLLAQYDKDHRIEMREQQFVDRIREIQKQDQLPK
jgi:uracil-DNA glycosylase